MKRTNRTWLCTVLFLDIVGYSKFTVDQQMLVKKNFSTVVSDALTGLPDQDCIKLDTGDGLAVCYLGAPEEVLYVALALRDAFIGINNICSICYGVRMGINIGPVRILDDINGQRNIIGDGINVAQRIMGFAQPNQLLVSRTYYEMVNCLSEEYQKLFSYAGIHNDKHVRQHAIYEVVPSAHSQLMGDGETHITVAEDSAPQNKAVFDLDEHILKVVQEQLALYIGPMAKLLIKKALKSSHNLDELYENLAQDIPTEQERERFLVGKEKLH